MEYPHIGHSKFWNDICHKVFGPREGGAKVLFDAEDAALGAGKTSAAVALARHLATAFDYELRKDDLTLSAAEYIDRYREHPGRDQPSVLVLDEAVGAGAGDARRAMSNSNLDLASAWQTMRVKRVVTIATLAHWGDLDSRLQRLADYRCQCRLKPIGRYRPYEITVGFDDGKPRTKKMDSAIHFPDMSGDPFYEHVSERKDELLEAATWDADELGEDEDADGGDDARGPKDIANEIIEDERIEEFVSVHSTNKTEYVDKDMIELEYDIVERDARKVQKLLRRERDADEEVPA
jgi:hypothetical protein